MFLEFDEGAVRDITGELDAWKARMDRKGPLSRRWTGRLRRDLEAETIAASTRMEGVAVTVDEVRRILVGDPPATVASADRKLVEGYRDAMTFVLRRADDPNFEWNRELLVGIQDRVLGGDFEAGAGRLRTGPAYIVSRDEDRIVFEPPDGTEVPGLVDDLCSHFTALEAHASVAAAWLHVAFAAVHPFRDGNGRTARVLASLVMYRGGFRSQAFTSLEEWWGSHPDDYYAAFACLGSQFDRSRDVTPFVAAHVGAQLSQVRALDLRERTQRRLWTMLENVAADAGLPDRLTNALWDAFFGREVTAGYYRAFVDVSPATATSDLRAATAADLVDAVGATRGRRYVAGPALLRSIQEQLGLAGLPDSLRAARGIVVAELGARLADGSGVEATDRQAGQETLFT
jgi:Fic family protein